METPRARLFDRLKTGLEEGIEYARGERTLRTTDLYLPDPPRAYTEADIKELRDKLNLSQSVFAQVLCVSTKTIQSWEQGLRTPNQATARLLQVIEDPSVLDSITARSAVAQEKPRRLSLHDAQTRRSRSKGKSRVGQEA